MHHPLDPLTSALIVALHDAYVVQGLALNKPPIGGIVGVLQTPSDMPPKVLFHTAFGKVFLATLHYSVREYLEGMPLVPASSTAPLLTSMTAFDTLTNPDAALIADAEAALAE